MFTKPSYSFCPVRGSSKSVCDAMESPFCQQAPPNHRINKKKLNIQSLVKARSYSTKGVTPPRA
jgi:hypothetical protein